MAGLNAGVFLELEAQGLVREKYLYQSPQVWHARLSLLVPIELRLTTLGNKLVNLAKLSEVRTRDWWKNR